MNSTAKIACLFLFTLTLIVTNSFLVQGLLALLTIMMVLLSRVPLKLYVKSFKILVWFLLLLLLVNFLCIVSFQNNILLVSKVLLLIIYTSVITYTTPPTEITYGIEEVLKPLKRYHVPVREIALTITLLLRFIPTLVETADSILKTQASRGIDFRDVNIRTKILIITSLIGPMFTLSYKKVKDLSKAMEVRLYNYARTRNNYRTNAWRKTDTRMIILHVSVIVIYIIYRLKEVLI